MRLLFATMVLMLALVASGCLFRKGPADTTPPSTRGNPGASTNDVSTEDFGGQDCLGRLEQMRAELDEIQVRYRVAQTTLREVRQQDRQQQALLQDAVREVVRTKAKLQSLESKAETASALAEVEVELKRLREDYGGHDTAELTQATRYLTMGSEEFERKNFSGALYLTSQARSHLAAARTVIDEAGATVGFEGEIVFDDVRFLQTLKNSNLRRGPGLEYAVLGTLDRGNHVAGYSQLGEWLRVVNSDGLSGWIHEDLLGLP